RDVVKSGNLSHILSHVYGEYFYLYINGRLEYRGPINQFDEASINTSLIRPIDSSIGKSTLLDNNNYKGNIYLFRGYNDISYDISLTGPEVWDTFMMERERLGENLPYTSDKLVLYLDFSDYSNTDLDKGIVYDKSGKGNHALLRNFNYTDISGYLDDGIKLDGSDDYIEVPY